MAIDQMTSELYTLIHFGYLFLLYFIPCLIGSTVSYFLKRNSTISKKRKNPKFLEIVGGLVTSTIIPSILMIVLRVAITDKHISSEYLYALAVVMGVMGGDITKLLGSFKNASKIIKFIIKGSESIDNLTKVIDDLDDEIEQEEKKSKPNNQD